MKQWWNNSFSRFLLVGVVNTLVGLSLIFFLLNVLQLNYWCSTFTGNALASIVSFLLNKNFTFRYRSKDSRIILRFFMVNLLCYALSYRIGLSLSAVAASLSVNQHSRKFTENIAVLTGSGIYTLTNYLAHKYYTFRMDQPKKETNKYVT